MTPANSQKPALPRQTLLDAASCERLGVMWCPLCGAGGRLGELCLYEEGSDGEVTTHAVWCRDCEAGVEGFLTLTSAIDSWNRRAQESSDLPY